MMGRTGRVLGALGLAGLVALPWQALAASPGDCTWGQPGYKECVDALIARRRDQDRREPAATEKKRETFRTAPARKRPPALTPLDTQGQPMAPVRLPRVPPLPNDTQRTMDENLFRMQRDADRPAIMPPGNEIIPVPGRICPTGGC